MDQDETCHRGRTRPRPHCVRWGPSLPPPQKKGGRAHSKFSAHVYCVETAGWITMPLGTDVGLGPGHIVLDGDPALPQKGAQQPTIFGQCLLMPNGWMDQDATWYGGRPGPWPHCVDGDSVPSRRGTAPNFWPMFVVAKRLDGSRCHLVRW